MQRRKCRKIGSANHTFDYVYGKSRNEWRSDRSVPTIRPRIRARAQRSRKPSDDGVSVAEVCRKAGHLGCPLLQLAHKCAGLLQAEMRRMSQLGEENANLKRIVMGLPLGKAMLQDVRAKKALRPDAMREFVNR